MLKRFWWIIFIVLPTGGMIGGGFVAGVWPDRYKATALVEVRPTSSYTIPAFSSTPEPAWPDGDRALVTACSTLEPVVHDLLLSVRWSLDYAQATDRLADILIVAPVKNHRLLKITARHEEPNFTRGIALAVAESYIQRKSELARKSRDRALAAIHRESAIREADLEIKRKRLADLIRRTGDLQPGQDESVTDSELEKLRVQSQLAAFDQYEGDRLWNYAAGFDLPANSTKTLVPSYLEAERELERLKKADPSSGNKAVAKQQEAISGLQDEIDRSVTALRETLESRLESLEAQTSGKHTDHPDYDEIHGDLRTAVRRLDQIRLQQVAHDTSEPVPRKPAVIRKHPTTPLVPSSPDHSRFQLVGASIGVVLGLLIPLLHNLSKPSPA